jgi:hypothetical protein
MFCKCCCAFGRSGCEELLARPADELGPAYVPELPATACGSNSDERLLEPEPPRRRIRILGWRGIAVGVGGSRKAEPLLADPRDDRRFRIDVCD